MEGFIVHAGLREPDPSHDTKISKTKKPQPRPSVPSQTTPWSVVWQAMVVPMVAPLDKAVATKERASSYKPFHG